MIVDCASRPSGLLASIALLGEARRSARGGAIVVDCPLVVAGHLQEVRADGIEAVVAGEALVELVEERKPRFGTVGHRGRDRLVERHDRVSGHLLKQAVERQDLRAACAAAPRTG